MRNNDNRLKLTYILIMTFVNQQGLIFNLSNQYNAPNLIQLFRNNNLKPSQNLCQRYPENDGIDARG